MSLAVLTLCSLTAHPPAALAAAPPPPPPSADEAQPEAETPPQAPEPEAPTASDPAEVTFSETTPAPAQDLDFAADVPPPPPVRFADDATTSRSQDAQVEFRGDAQGQPTLVESRFTTPDEPAPSFESPQRFAIELKFGPYLPGVDADYPGPGLGAYAEVFGETNERGVAVDQPRKRVMSQLGFDWQFLQVGGPLSVGTSIGFFQDRAQGLLVDTSPDDPSVRSEADRVRFSVLPVTLLLGYRLEVLADRFKVPLVPYAKGGLAYGFWWSSDGDREVSTNSEGVKGRGGSIGWQANLGLMLRLDFLDRASARALDSSTGINHTYIFGEWQFSRMDGFGSAFNKVQVGDDTWYLGLAIEL